MRRFCLGLLTAALTFSLGVATAPTLRPRHRRAHVGRPAAPPERPRPRLHIAPMGGLSDAAVLGNGELWAVGSDEHGFQTLWHSSDWGRAWEMRASPTGDWVSDIQFTDGRHGWAAGMGNFLLRTSDGGETWERLVLPLDLGPVKVHFFNSRVGYVAGGTGGAGRLPTGIAVLRTDDGGRSWRVCYRDREALPAVEIAAPSEQVAVVAVESQSLLRTEDGGRTWKNVAAHERAGFKHVTFSPDGTGWAVGDRSFARSDDGGKTWRTPDNLPPDLLNHDWSAVDFADSQTGMAVSRDFAIAITRDGGRTWEGIETNLHEGGTIGHESYLWGLDLAPGGGVIKGSLRVYRIVSFE